MCWFCTNLKSFTMVSYCDLNYKLLLQGVKPAKFVCYNVRTPCTLCLSTLCLPNLITCAQFFEAFPLHIAHYKCEPGSGAWVSLCAALKRWVCCWFVWEIGHFQILSRHKQHASLLFVAMNYSPSLVRVPS